MPGIVIDGRELEAEGGQTVMQVALAHDIPIPAFCWHPALSIAGNCRVCMVEVEGRGLALACNLPIYDGLKVHTDTEAVRNQRKLTLQFLTLNHPVDCGICDKAGECLLQDYHYAHNGSPSTSIDPKVHATKHYSLGSRIVLDNERCILCSRCVRFTREVSGSNVLGIKHRGDTSLVRPAEGRSLDDDPYSDNVIDICPVGALLSRAFLHQSRVWYLTTTPSVCPGCARGCTIDVWHRKPEWRLQAVATHRNHTIARVTPHENPAVNGPWICNKGRDLAALVERPRALEPMVKGEVVAMDQALEAARQAIAGAQRPLALVSSWGSNEELDAFKEHLAPRFSCAVKEDHRQQPNEPGDDHLLLRADKNPNTTRARALFGETPAAVPEGTDLVLVWGEGFDFDTIPDGVATIVLGAFDAPENGLAAVFVPLSIHTERAGHFTNFEGVVSAFAPCFPPPATVADAETVFPQLAPQGATS
ncbi:MAG: 2Fe-2S iron-sulfur cluster-binding protein [Gammaproteobacteria bacterium]|nr:2Fe-2S iron-sulfur cluster-binding protein [Gammaproteobacteria bacterium]